MHKLVTFILWPIMAGIVLSLSLLIFPSLLSRLPSLEHGGKVFTEEKKIQSYNYSKAIKKAAPAVVSISSSQVELSLREQQTAIPFITELVPFIELNNNLGSGVIISPDGYIITSLHIFSTAYEASTVTLNDNRSMEARMLAIDESNDLALLKVDGENLPYISLGLLNSLEVGDIVLAIGNPRNVGQSVSLGIISALLKRDETFVIQTDAAINPGNSGGALIDTRGNLIGINSTIVSESGGSEGIGFASPADRAITLMEAYIDSGPSGYLGVQSELFSVSSSGLVIGGLKITHVTENSPADRAGIRNNDIILGVNNTPVNENYIEFIKVLSSYAPGETVTMEIFRGSEILHIPTTLGVGEPYIFPVYTEITKLNKPAAIN